MYGKNLVSHSLGLTQTLWSYLQLAILVIATARGRYATKKIATKTSSKPSSTV
jgi:hypothetical protein